MNETIIEPSPIDKPKRKPGRPWGVKNYNYTSLIARAMHAQDVFWVKELVASYQLYKEQLETYNEYMSTLPIDTPPVLAEPDGTLLNFWTALLPYLTQTLSEKDISKAMYGGKRFKQARSPKIKKSTLDQLAKMEGRPHGV